MYITKTDIEKYLLISIDVTGEPFVESAIRACQTHIENLCGDLTFGKRVFKAPDPDVDVTKYFNGNGTQKLSVGDLRSITSLSVDGIEMVENQDFYTVPLNAVADNRPITGIELVQPMTATANQNPRSGRSPYIFEPLQRNVIITGKWGYSAKPPEDIKMAVIKMVAGIIRENLTDPTSKTVSSESLGEYSVNYSKMNEILNQVGANDLIAPYYRTLAGKKIVSGVIQAS